ncbi:hypothetical protein EKG37_21240 [Robertmurraya yapensis]|uniref:Uncharacterized protein n=1 Tax=Bacillus yapensis TaxID=2492960 RepID=A0A431VTQ2_9BACI|nr:hypothetical protein [Bacillus yapensis]RTR26596.1 hypothetical protein EKG37_21240 [Bacillus yapensis]TKS93771.1 hypothetical protein FAR12_21245 [Bacillus yapensis]
MAKVCFYTVDFLEEARYTADNLLIAKMMSDYGKPLDPDLKFYVKNSNNDSSLFFDALNILFQFVKIDEEYDEKMHETKTKIVLCNEEINRWLHLTNQLQETSMIDAFRMVQVGIESTLFVSSDYFDGEVAGEFIDEGIILKLGGSSGYVLFYEILESIISFINALNKQLQIWEGYYYEYTKGNNRDTYHAS